jgi:hypothetical protein
MTHDFIQGRYVSIACCHFTHACHNNSFSVYLHFCYRHSSDITTNKQEQQQHHQATAALTATSKGKILLHSCTAALSCMVFSLSLSLSSFDFLT